MFAQLRNTFPYLVLQLFKIHLDFIHFIFGSTASTSSHGLCWFDLQQLHQAIVREIAFRTKHLFNQRFKTLKSCCGLEQID